MSDQDYGKPEWQEDEAAAMAEALRRIHQAAETGADTLDFCDLAAMQRLPEELALVPGLKRLFAGWVRPDESTSEGILRPRLGDITALRHVTGLRALNLSGTQISDAAPLAGLTALTELDLPVTQIEDATPLARLAMLRVLDLSNTPIRDVDPLSGLTKLKMLNLSFTQVADVAPLAGLTMLTDVMLSHTQISDFTPLYGLRRLSAVGLMDTALPSVEFLLDLPEFAAERGRYLSYRETPAAKVDNRFGMLSGLPGAQCALQTVQYLKGTHPDFRDPLPQKGKVTQAGLVAFSPVAFGRVGDQLEVVNPAPPQRVNPVEAAQRVAGLRAQVALIRQEAQQTQCAPALLRRLDAYAEGVQPDLPIWFVIDAAMQMIEGSLEDEYLSQAVDRGLKRGFDGIVKAHHALRPFLMPPTDAEEAALAALPPLDPRAGAGDVEAMVGEVLEVMAEPDIRDKVGQQLHNTLKAVEDLAISYKQRLDDRPGLLRRVVMPFGGMLAVLSNAATLHGWWLGPTGVALAARLQPLIDRFLQWFPPE